MFANTSIGARIKFDGYILQEKIVSPSFFSFSLINSILMFWNAQTYAMALMVLLLSGLFP